MSCGSRGTEGSAPTIRIAIGVISTAFLNSKMQQYCAFQSHNKSRKAKTYTAGWLRWVLLLSTSFLLSYLTLEIVFPLCFLLADGQCEGPRLHIWGDVSHCLACSPQQNRNNETNKAGDHPAWDLLLHVFIFWFSFCFGVILNSEASAFTRERCSKSRNLHWFIEPKPFHSRLEF